ncbi:MAG: hypothetical protein P1V97_00690 [Planctomycetota bacterium]|nr:hypothetical protein [Planctomycetota bacterium]
MDKILRVIILLSALSLAACQPGPVSEKKTESKTQLKAQLKAALANGFYVVLGEGNTEDEARAFKSEQVLIYEYKYHQYEDGEEKDTPVYLALNSAPNVPLTLAEDPKTETDKKGSPLLKLQLNEKASEELERFTGKHLGKTVAIVIGGEVISKHKVKAAIKGGRLQITWCSANACETLQLKLKQGH